MPPHYRLDCACGDRGTETSDVSGVTCRRCRSTLVFMEAGGGALRNGFADPGGPGRYGAGGQSTTRPPADDPRERAPHPRHASPPRDDPPVSKAGADAK